ncbi:MAG: hypothetical protein ACYTGZ_05600 [Planctomycetota bacterium]|jgi:hypothetical protein
MPTPPSDTRSEVRAFGASLLVVVQGLFFGALFFTYLYRRSHAAEWRAAWDDISGAPARLIGALLLFAAAWAAYPKARGIVSAVCGALACFVLMSVIPQSRALTLEGGSRAPAISLFACSFLFAVQALLLAVMGVVAKGQPVFRRFLLFQLVAALLVLPVVFVW